MNILILCIETSAEFCSVALSRNGKLMDELVSDQTFAHSEQLAPMILKILKRNSLEPHSLSAISLGGGPGSYTGLRIGCSLAKGMCFSLDIPLIVLETTRSLAYQAKQRFPAAPMFLAVIDARRDEVYSAVYSSDLKILDPVGPKVLDENTFAGPIKKGAIVCGDAVQKMAHLVPVSQSFLTIPTANALVELSFNNFISDEFADLDSYEPHYVKSANITSKAKKNPVQ
jgi:tRNA threonylcarbamoyladenosine biosynthesis protein TsaB